MPDMTHGALPAVAIIGGGFTGTAIAYHLDRLAAGAARIIVIEPRATLGGGLAYSTMDPAHRVNVPAVRMSLDPDDPSQFENWLAESGALVKDPDALLVDGRCFPLRSVFARYVSERVAPLLSANRVIHKRAKVLRVIECDGSYELFL